MNEVEKAYLELLAEEEETMKRRVRPHHNQKVPFMKKHGTDSRNKRQTFGYYQQNRLPAEQNRTPTNLFCIPENVTM